jgi:hypothetical protein
LEGDEIFCFAAHTGLLVLLNEVRIIGLTGLLDGPTETNAEQIMMKEQESQDLLSKDCLVEHPTHFACKCGGLVFTFPNPENPKIMHCERCDLRYDMHHLSFE